MRFIRNTRRDGEGTGVRVSAAQCAGRLRARVPSYPRHAPAGEVPRVTRIAGKVVMVAPVVSRMEVLG